MVASRFKGFDDGLDETSLLPSRHVGEDHKAVGTGDERTIADAELGSPEMTSSRNIRKRPHTPSEDDDEDEMLDEMLPAAAAMKRRRIEESNQTEGQNTRSTRSNRGTTAEVTSKKPKKAKKDMDVRGVARELKEAEEAASRQEQETLQASLDGVNVAQMRDLAIIEIMPVQRRSDRPSRAHAYGDQGDRWDEKWNGRRNFKKFRKRGVDNPQLGRRGRGGIVGFEEVRKKDYGIGDDYWVERDREKRTTDRARLNQSSVESQSQPYTTARSQPTASGRTEDAVVPRVVEGSSGRRTASKPSSQAASQVSRNNPVISQPASLAGKRGASSSSIPGEGSSKRQRTTYVRNSESDESDDDGLKFRFRKPR